MVWEGFHTGSYMSSKQALDCLVKTLEFANAGQTMQHQRPNSSYPSFTIWPGALKSIWSNCCASGKLTYEARNNKPVLFCQRRTQVISGPGINAHQNRAGCTVCVFVLRQIQETTRILICPRPWTYRSLLSASVLVSICRPDFFHPPPSKRPGLIQLYTHR